MGGTFRNVLWKKIRKRIRTEKIVFPPRDQTRREERE